MKRWFKYISRFSLYFVGLLLFRWCYKDALNLNGDVIFIATLFGGLGCLKLYWEGE